MNRRLTFLSLLLLLFSTTAKGALTEVEIQGAYIINFIRFTQWPDKLPNNEINLCVLGNSSLYAVLQSQTGRKFGENTLNVLSLDESQLATEHCQTLFIGYHTVQRTLPIIKLLNDAPILTLSAAPDFAQRGGMIGLIYNNNRILFEVNLAAARRASLYLSSQVLNLAHTLYRE